MLKIQHAVSFNLKKTDSMKFKISLAAVVICIAACNNNDQQARLKALAEKDSTIAAESQHKDSVISGYITSMNEVQDNLDSIEAHEHILSLKKSEELKSEDVVDQVKSIDGLILANNKKIYGLEYRLKNEKQENTQLEKMLGRLIVALAVKDAEISDLQIQLSASNGLLTEMSKQFSDSIAMIHKKRDEISALENRMNTVYYAIGTEKELKDKGIIDNKGGILGIGNVAEINPNSENKNYTKGDAAVLNGIALNGKFKKLITPQENKSYRISKNSDSLVITNQPLFWGKSKYLVVQIK